jgi:hypothetical protein
MGGARGMHGIITYRVSGGKPLQRRYGSLGVYGKIISK